MCYRSFQIFFCTTQFGIYKGSKTAEREDEVTGAIRLKVIQEQRIKKKKEFKQEKRKLLKGYVENVTGDKKSKKKNRSVWKKTVKLSPPSSCGCPYLGSVRPAKLQQQYTGQIEKIFLHFFFISEFQIS